MMVFRIIGECSPRDCLPLEDKEVLNAFAQAAANQIRKAAGLQQAVAKV